ncbi:MAG: hypothetical protein WCP65_02890 [Bacteroidota bacterium]
MDKYIMTGTPVLSNEWDIFTVDENGNQVPTDTYGVNISIGLHPTDNVAPDFTKTIVSVSHNSQTGFEVDAQRQQDVANYLAQINNV